MYLARLNPKSPTHLLLNLLPLKIHHIDLNAKKQRCFLATSPLFAQYSVWFDCHLSFRFKGCLAILKERKVSRGAL